MTGLFDHVNNQQSTITFLVYITALEKKGYVECKRFGEYLRYHICKDTILHVQGHAAYEYKLEPKVHTKMYLNM